MSTLALLAEKKHRIERERIGPAYQPPAPVATHLQRLLEGGWTQVEIAAHTGIGRRTLHGLLKGERPSVNRTTADAVLALQPQDPPGRILPTGSMRRVQGLAANGWTIRQTARDAGLHEQFLRDLVVGRYRRISRQHAEAIARVCRARFLTPGPSKVARTTASRNGWVPVTAWEDIDDPACQPDARRAAA